ncbi:flagellar hook-length control protein FliK [uncultured Sphingomonas sp.]|uniref:flagellar hook-length control protein FliK n=1 Tax=uncultured Sphingomonas sp. TaxID=158754 RepID=UPI0035CC35D2
MPSVATSFFLPPTGAALPGVAPRTTPTAAAAFGVALANAVPTVAVDAAPPAATVPLAGFATPATLTVLNDIAMPSVAAPTPPTHPAPVAPALPQVEASPPPMIAPAPSKPTIATELSPDPQSAILVVGTPNIPTQNIATATEVLPTPASPKFVKTLPAILIAAPLAAAPPANAAEGEAAPARQRPTAPIAAATGAPTVAVPATTAAAIDTMQAPTPQAPTARIADEVETPRKLPRAEPPEPEAPVPDAAPPIMPAPAAAAIVVSAATFTVTAPAKLPADEAPADGPIAPDPVTATTDVQVQVQVQPEKTSTRQPHPVFLRTQEPRATNGKADDPGLLPAQEHGGALAQVAPVLPITTPAPTTQMDETAESRRKIDEPEAMAVAIEPTPNLPIAPTVSQPTPLPLEPVTQSPAAEHETAAKARAQAITAAAGPPLAPEPAPVTDKSAPGEVATRLPATAEPRTAAAEVAPAPAPGVPAPPPVPGPALLTPAPQFAAAVAPAPREAGTVAAEPGRIGREMGVIIARHAATGGGETITVRLDPQDMGRIDVTLSFDDDGRLRAVVAADNPAALDLLRRDSADLNRALVDAGVRADPQSLRFDTRSGGDEQATSGQSGQRRGEARAGFPDASPADLPDEPDHRPRAASGRIDMMA